jgi:hypothetical protein
VLVETFRAQHWDALFRDSPDRQEVRLRQKRDDRELTLPLESVRFGDVRLSASAFLGVDTPLGPIHFAYGFTRGVDPGWTLRIGPVF